MAFSHTRQQDKKVPKVETRVLRTSFLGPEIRISVFLSSCRGAGGGVSTPAVHLSSLRCPPSVPSADHKGAGVSKANTGPRGRAPSQEGGGPHQGTRGPFCRQAWAQSSPRRPLDPTSGPLPPRSPCTNHHPPPADGSDRAGFPEGPGERQCLIQVCKNPTPRQQFKHLETKII